VSSRSAGIGCAIPHSEPILELFSTANFSSFSDLSAAFFIGPAGLAETAIPLAFYGTIRASGEGCLHENPVEKLQLLMGFDMISPEDEGSANLPIRMVRLWLTGVLMAAEGAIPVNPEAGSQ
jgi:hypothetical protein